MVIVNGAVSKKPAVLESRTTMPEKVPGVSGMPLITPALLKLSPLGNAPAFTLKKGAGKPVAV